MAVLRNLFLWASTNAWLRERAMRTAVIRRSVSSFMPGEHLDDALHAANALRSQRITTILTRLGENLERLADADEVRDHYFKVIDRVRASGLDAQVSVKPTQLGYDQDVEACFRHLATIADRAVAAGNFLWLDMESSPYVDGTIALYRRLRERTPRVGLAIQAYLHRSAKDVDALGGLGAAIRLVKGAYMEPAAVAYPKKADVDANYLALASRLLRRDADRPGALLHIATHDVPLQERLRQVIAEQQVRPERYEFAMLYGIRADRQRELASAGEPMRCLISYGESWFPWYMRRLAERPANLGFVLRNAFR